MSCLIVEEFGHPIGWNVYLVMFSVP